MEIEVCLAALGVLFGDSCMFTLGSFFPGHCCVVPDRGSLSWPVACLSLVMCYNKLPPSKSASWHSSCGLQERPTPLLKLLP